MTDIKRVRINDIVESQIPEFLNEESPLFKVFLKSYYNSLDHKSGAIDLVDNIKFYKSVEAFNNNDLVQSTTLNGYIYASDSTINVDSTDSWPEKYGLLKIDDEIITYTEKTATSFIGCIRGFSGIDQIKSTQNSEFLQFQKTEAEEHEDNSIVYNLSNLFLVEFFEKFKYEFVPGFESRSFSEGISSENILTRIKDFYRSKGTNSSYEILFKILYGKDIQIIKPQDYTLVPSSNSYFVTKNILVEKISGGDPTETKGNFLYQNLPGIGTVSASIYNVEYRPIGNKLFYEISLDSTSFSGVFQVSGKTKVLEYTPAGSNSILVDSTIGFSKSGKLLVKPKDSNYIEITYSDKSSNQFLGVSGVTKPLDFSLDIVEEKFAYSYIGVGNTSKVDFRVINVIDSIDFSETSNLKVGDKIRLSGFGKDMSSSYQFSSWIYNVPTNHNIKNVSQVDSDKYRIILYDEVSFYKEQTIKLEDILGNISDATILDVEYPAGDTIKKYTNRILVQVTGSTFNVLDSKILKTLIIKSSHFSNDYSYINIIPSGVQNTYIDFKEQNFYVTSTGLPNYTIEASDTKKTISVVGASSTSLIYCPRHNIQTGESVYYDPGTNSTSGLSTGFYFVTRVDLDNIKLSFSKNDIFSKKYITLNPLTGNLDFIYKSGYQNKIIKNQKIFKKFDLTGRKKIFDDKNKRSTNNKQIGLLSNGVEILSPTLFDENIYYGKLSSIEVTNSGKDYDVVNVPQIIIQDEQGSNAKAHLNLSGEVKSIKVINPGIGYQTKPKITITGGNGSGCVLESNLVKSRITVGFRPSISVDVGSNSITFINNHNLVDGEEIIYNSNGNANIIGLVDKSHYFVGVSSEKIIKLYNTFTDAVDKTNEINITGISSGSHSLETLKNKNTITRVYVKDPGKGYSNRAVRIPSQFTTGETVGINTFDSYIFATKHGFNDGELVTYNHTGTPISGLSTSINYYVKVLDANRFKLSVAGIGTTLSKEDFSNKKYVKFSSVGLGTHIIAYPPITINVETISEIGESSIVTPILQPVVLGSISDVYLEDGGIGYGCTDILNFHRRPLVTVQTVTSECVLKPIILGGSIIDVKIINSGNGYRADSDIVISGDGSFAEIDPIVTNGRVTGVNVLRGGVGYASSNTVLTVVNRGKDAKFLANVNEWKINQVIKLSGQISNEDDGVLFPSKNEDLGLQFINFYAPKKLRYQLDDNFTETNKESPNNKVHSPILGFSYDGYPIYGPYGYDPLVGGTIRLLKTSYELQPDLTPGIRPPGFIAGYFIDDYIFTGSGDLDQYNGRWCKTPQYPNGTYAYFSSITVDPTGKSSPTYPYIIGKYFRGTPIEDNFLQKINQDTDLSSYRITRNIGPYYINSNNSGYDLIDKISDTYKQEFRVKEVQDSGIESAVIFSPGDNYRINDRLLINNKNTSGTGANIVVDSLKGKEIESFMIEDVKIENVTFLFKNDVVVVQTTEPHELSNGEVITITGVSTITASELEGNWKVSVENKTVQLSENITVAASGVTTFIGVKDINGFNVNDVIGIGTEILRIVDISAPRSGFYVNRLANPGIHTAGIDNVRLLPTSFEFVPKSPVTQATFENSVTFFNPKETVGTGTDKTIRYIVGIGTSTVEARVIPSRSIYIPNHRFYTGEPLLYGPGLGGTSLYFNNVGSGVSIPLLDGQIVYAVNLGKDHIGLSTLGFTTTSGIGTNLNSVEFVNFDYSFSIIGSAHSLTTLYPEIKGSISKHNGIVTTTSSHGLSNNDIVNLSINNRELDEVKILYNPEIRKLTTAKIPFANTDVSIADNTIGIGSAILKTGDKVVYHTEGSTVGGLQNNSTYYILRLNLNRIQLCEYESDIKNSNVIDLTSTGHVSHGFYLINPPLNFVEGSIIKFDLSDPSLLEMDLQFYEDPDFQNTVEVIGNDIDNFVISRTLESPGTFGSYVTLDSSNKQYPKLLYYNLIAKNPLDLRKKEITSDREVKGNNKLTVTKHSLDKSYIVSVPNDTTFTFNLSQKLTKLEEQAYISSNENVTYTTKSKTALGPINSLKINFPGRGYKKLPFVEGIDTQFGENAIIKLKSSKIGRVEDYERIKDGFDYPTDPTLTPSLSVPTVIGIRDILTIDSVGILTGGRGYNTAPTLFVKDNPSIKLKADITGGSVTKVTIVNNSTSLSSPLQISSIYNSNGYDIDNVSVSGNDVTLELLDTNFINVGFGNTQIDFPFAVGDEIFIEGCRLTNSTSSKANFNSKSYGYRFFKITSTSVENKTITYSMSGISTGDFGTYDDTITLGYVVNKKSMPSFEMILNDNVNYLSGERVTSRVFSGNVMEGGWDNELNQLRINDSAGSLIVGDRIFGENSKINGVVEYFDTFNLNSTLGVSRDKVGVIDNAVGILNDFQQRISDNFYYQKFSYAIKSEIPYDSWRESVRSLVHPSGFKEFSDLEIVTEATQPEVQIGISKSTDLRPTVLESASSFLVNVDNKISIGERSNFNLVYEEDFLDDGSVEKVFFNEGIALRNYILNKTNKVVTIDDISSQFDGSSIQTLDGTYADASDLLDGNKAFIQQEVVGFITATYPGIVTSVGWSKTSFTEEIGNVVDAISHDIKYNSNNKSVGQGLDYWSGIGTSYISGITTERLSAYNYITDISKYIINNVGVKTSYQLGTPFAITTSSYNNVTGIQTIRLTPANIVNLNASVGDYVVVKNLVFSCNSGGGISTAIFPNLGAGLDGNGPLSPKGFVYEIIGIGLSTIEINPGISTIDHTYVGGGTVEKAFISTSQYYNFSILADSDCSVSYSSSCCANVQSSIVNYVGIITTIIGLGTASSPEITYPSITRGGVIVGLTTFKLTSNGNPLFKREFSGSDSNVIKIDTDTFIFNNHNFQSGQELIYTYSGTPIGIATTSYTTEIKDILMQVGNYNGTSIYENGYGAAITTSITGISTVLVPAGPTTQLFNDVVGTSTSGGINAVFDVVVSYSATTGQPLSTSISLVSGGKGFAVGQTVSIAGTYFKGSNPTNNLSFVVSSTGPTVIQAAANQTYSNVPSLDVNGATFSVSRNNDGEISSIQVTNGGSGYASTSVISIAGTYIGGSNSNDNVSFTPIVLGSNKLPKSVFVTKLDDSKFKLSGLSTATILNIVGFGTGIHSFEYKEPNTSSIITIDGVIQTPIRSKSLSITLGSPVSSASTTLIQVLTGISSLYTGDIINMNSEYVVVKNIGVAGTDIIKVERGYLGTSAGVHTVGVACTVLTGDYNIVGDVIYFTTAPYGKIGPVGLKTGSIFGGRVFSRQFDPGEPEDKNIILDDISLSFTGIAATEFTAKTKGSTTTALFNNTNSSTNINNNPIILINNVFQRPRTDYDIDGTSENVIKFLTGTPSAGKIVKVGVTTGYGYYPLLGASAVANVSAAGTISSLTLTGSGSGYRLPPTVGIYSTVGSGASITALVSAAGTITGFTIVNAGSGYTTTSIPEVVIGIPTAYSNLGVAYTGGSSGVGQGAKISVTVGQGSSIIDYKIDNPGIGYKVGDILKVPNLLINSGLSTVFQEFRLTVREVQTDKFSGFYPGQFILFDDFSDRFNGFRKKFTLSVTNNNVREILSLKTLAGTDLNLENNLFIYINDILQIPGVSYTFSGSRVLFTEAPKQNSTCTVLYYRGSSIDVEEVTPPPTLKEGDTIIIKENEFDLFDTDQLERIVKKISASDQIDTFTYNSVGIITDPNKNRPLTWIKQEYDRIISGQLYSKSRLSLKSSIRPVAKLIKSVTETDSVIYVDNAFPIFSDVDLLSEDKRNVVISEVKNISAAICTSIVSSSSTISSISVVDGGVGYAYTQNPVISISKSLISRKDPIKDWKPSTGITTGYELNSLIYGNTLVAVGSSSLYATSIDAESWSTGSIGFGGTINFTSVSCGGTNVYMAVGEYGIVSKSLGYGSTVGPWTLINLLEESVVPGLGLITRFPTTYTGTLNDIVYSPNLDSWTAVGAAGSIFGGVGIGSTMLISRFSGTLQNINSITYSPSGLVAVGDNGVILSSANNVIWDSNSSPTSFNLNKVIYVNGNYVVVGDFGVVLKGMNPSSLQLMPVNISENLVDVYYNDFYVAITSNGDLYYSFDLSTWIYRDTNQPNNLKDILQVPTLGLEGRYISVGSAGTAIYSDPIFNRATAIGYVSSGILTSVEVTNGGFGYQQDNEPPVLVEPDIVKIETIKSFKVIGDFGTIIGINTFVAGTPGIGTTSPKIEFILKSETYDNSTLGIGYSSLNNFGVDSSQLSKGDYFIITDSNVTVGHALTGITTSLGGMSNYPNSRVGTAYTYLDGVYRVESVTTASVGIVTVSCNFAPLESPAGNYIEVYKRGEDVSGVNTNGFYGRYSWSKIYDYQNRALGTPEAFDINTNNGLTGLSTAPQVTRTISV